MRFRENFPDSAGIYPGTLEAGLPRLGFAVIERGGWAAAAILLDAASDWHAHRGRMNTSGFDTIPVPALG